MKFLNFLYFCAVLRIRDVYPGSRILIFTHPGSRIPDLGSRISDPGSKNSNKREGWKKFDVISFYGATNLAKLYIILILKCWRKKIWADFQRIIELFAQKIVTKLSSLGSGIRDPGSGKNLFRIPDPGVKKAPDPGSGSATLLLWVIFALLDPDPESEYESGSTNLIVSGSKIRIRNPDSDPDFFTHPGSRIQVSKRHRTPDPQHWLKLSESLTLGLPVEPLVYMMMPMSSGAGGHEIEVTSPFTYIKNSSVLDPSLLSGRKCR